MSVKHGVRPPQLTWDETLQAPAKMRPPYIVLHTKWFDAFAQDPGRALPMLSYVLAHEVRHWLTVAKHLPIPLPKGPAWRERRQEWEDESAYQFAEAETGISEGQFWAWWETPGLH